MRTLNGFAILNRPVWLATTTSTDRASFRFALREREPHRQKTRGIAMIKIAARVDVSGSLMAFKLKRPMWITGVAFGYADRGRVRQAGTC